MRRGDCPAVFSLEILRRNPCTGEESAPRETGRGTRQIFEQTDTAFCSHNISAPQKGIFIQTPQGLARRGFKNQNPARGRKQKLLAVAFKPLGYILRTRTPQGDGNRENKALLVAERVKFKNQNPARGRKLAVGVNHVYSDDDLRTRTPQGDGNRNIPVCSHVLHHIFKNQNPARGRKHWAQRPPQFDNVI